MWSKRQRYACSSDHIHSHAQVCTCMHEHMHAHTQSYTTNIIILKNTKVSALIYQNRHIIHYTSAIYYALITSIIFFGSTVSTNNKLVYFVAEEIFTECVKCIIYWQSSVYVQVNSQDLDNNNHTSQYHSRKFHTKKYNFAPKIIQNTFILLLKLVSCEYKWQLELHIIWKNLQGYNVPHLKKSQLQTIEQEHPIPFHTKTNTKGRSDENTE